MATTLVQPCGGCACGGPTVTAGACVSREGGGSLCGWSKFQNQNTGDWTHLIYQTLSRAVDYSICNTELPQCPGDAGYTSLYQRFQWSGACSYSGCTAPSAGARQVSYNIGENNGTENCAYESIDVPATGEIDDTTLSGGACESPSTTTTDTSRSESYSSVCCNDGTFSYNQAGSDTQTLSSPDTPFAAITRAGGYSEGSSCKTVAGTRGTIASPFTEYSVSITGTIAVRVPLACANLTAATDYTVTISIERYTAGGGSYVDTITDEVTFTAAGTTEDIDYDVPANTDYDYKYAGVSIAQV